MKVLVVGSGGREHALIWKIKKSPLVKEVYCAPGNGGIAELAECVEIDSNDIAGLIKFAKDKKIDLTVVGPEAPLIDGIVDIFNEQGLKVFGPNRIAAQLEGSKVFSKEFMYDWNIPTAPFRTFDDIEEAKEFLERIEYPIVVKADGIAAGKGVIICKTNVEALDAVNQIMRDKVFGSAGDMIVIEECLQGEEASILAICDGENYCLLESSQDHKRIFDDDLGPNTGGMGAYSPAPIVTGSLIKEIEARVLSPVVRGMKEEGVPFKGVLYAGIMLTVEGPMVLEFNVRFGDPETQAILPRLKSDLVELMLASCNEEVGKINLSWDKRPAVCVVMSSGGYPGKFQKGFEIKGLDKTDNGEEGFVFHAGTKLEDEKIVTNGGRVLGVTSLGDTIEDAIKNTYKLVDKIHFEHCFFRRDIGAKALKNINSSRK